MGININLKHEWQTFHDKNPEVYELFERFAFMTIKSGFDHYGSMAILQRVRWHKDVETNDELFKINNNHAPFYARLFMKNHPQHEGFFRTRKSTADEPDELEGQEEMFE